MTTTHKERMLSVDVLKGLLIFSVVLGHCTVGREEFAYSLTADICYSFHMFLFIGLSGWLVGKKEKNREWIIRRGKRLMIPYFVWSCFFCIIKADSIVAFLYKLFFDPYLWYLIVLFLCDLIVCILEKCFRSRNRFIVSGLGCFLILNILYITNIISNIETFKMLAIYFIFYFIGYCLHKYEYAVNKRLSLICTILYPFSMILYQYKIHERPSVILSSIGLSDGIIQFLNKTGFVLYNHFVVAALGCFFFTRAAKVICKRTIYLRNTFSFLAKYTLQIYIISDLVKINFFRNTLVNVISSLVLGLLVPCAIGYFIHKNRTIEKVLFG